MTLIELKKSIHEKIDGLDDHQFLEHIAAIIENKRELFVIPEHMKEAIRQGIEDIKHGRVHSTEDFEKKYEKWLKE